LFQNTNQEKLLLLTDINLQSYFGRINLGFDSRYLLTVTVETELHVFLKRIDGVIFRSCLRGTYLRNHFLKDNSTLSNLKLRVGYGTTGQQDISAQYDYYEE
jgi:iron complex outermembrane receptor protein